MNSPLLDEGISMSKTLVGFATLFFATVSTGALAANLTIEATSQGVSVKGTDFTAVADSASYDDAKGLLVLQRGTLTISRNGHKSEQKAATIYYWPKDNSVQLLDIRAARAATSK
jgi:hypothetical protein